MVKNDTNRFKVEICNCTSCLFELFLWVCFLYVWIYICIANTKMLSINDGWVVIEQFCQNFQHYIFLEKYYPFVSDSPKISIDFRQPSATEPGWLNCTVSSKPVSNITWYRLSPSIKVIVNNIIRGSNTVNYSITDATGFDGVYLCTADNGIGIVVNSETRIISTCMCLDFYCYCLLVML